VVLVGLLADSFFDTFVTVQLALLLFADIALHATTATTNLVSDNVGADQNEFAGN